MRCPARPSGNHEVQSSIDRLLGPVAWEFSWAWRIIVVDGAALQFGCFSYNAPDFRASWRLDCGARRSPAVPAPRPDHRALGLVRRAFSMPTASCFAGLRQNVVNCGLLPDKFYSIQERRAGRGPLVEVAEDSRNCLKNTGQRRGRRGRCPQHFFVQKPRAFVCRNWLSSLRFFRSPESRAVKQRKARKVRRSDASPAIRVGPHPD
jgi:hypothetical protein